MNSEDKMEQAADKILVWLPSPMGDAILCTPALRALRKQFKNSKITFLGSETVRRILSPCDFNDDWLIKNTGNPLETIMAVRKNKFSQAILFKNSFSSAIACFLASIPKRTGYARDCRSFLLTERLSPQKMPDGRFKPGSMIDYYLAIASAAGCPPEEKFPELKVSPEDRNQIYSKFPQLKKPAGSVVILVPGGAFGPSKCWPAQRFAQTADRLISEFNAIVFVSVSPATAERQIAKDVCRQSKNKLIGLSENPLTIGELKALFSIAELVITNDTGPRHIAIALRRNVITLFGPNDPAWTDTGWQKEIKIVGQADCAPCANKICRAKQHKCMEAITVDMVCDAAKRLL